MASLPRTLKREPLVQQIARGLFALGRRVEARLQNDDGESQHDGTRNGEEAVDDHVSRENPVAHLVGCWCVSA